MKTTYELVDSYLKRIIKLAAKAKSENEICVACNDVISAINGAMESFSIWGDRPPKEGFEELYKKLELELFNENLAYKQVINFALKRIILVCPNFTE
ncbi:TPA: hypothetical protein PXO68_002672 [Yersinia enterocolitica]|uniref:hypothetical protein n=1 Tax=Yersinia enterocolitica TaxID=630 RepID=UPI00065A876B|nr:hypothetical protein [Yersinia enterocolitica]MBX9498792.1 hypothetical protein [Yersinia enterocolitica]CRY19654.1 Uncharacterised protein [Yersinia enterocolitica]SQA40372.1 Uncharacterised protein [Yersinia enterocolitica]SUP65442.1 Uncharacterised protein [Yersinia enterocolitica]HDL6510771.1 hypothetical protein [Yersinia enterocolitica]